MEVICHPFNNGHTENNGRFAFIETWNDQGVYHALIEFVSSWAKEKGMVKLVGLHTFSDKDPQVF